MKKILAIGTAAVFAFSLTGCGGEAYADDNYVGVCEDRQGNRVDDSLCSHAPIYSNGPSGTEAFFWGYMLSSMTMPRYGAHVTNVTYKVDDSRYNVYRGGVPSTGGRLNPDTYKPVASKVVKPDVSVKSKNYKNVYIQQDSTYKNKGQSKNNSYNYGSSNKGSVNKAPVYKAPAPVYRPAPRVR